MRIKYQNWVKMSRIIIALFLLSLCSTTKPQTTEKTTEDDRQECGNNTDLVTTNQFRYGEPLVDETVLNNMNHHQQTSKTIKINN